MNTWTWTRRELVRALPVGIPLGLCACACGIIADNLYVALVLAVVLPGCYTVAMRLTR